MDKRLIWIGGIAGVLISVAGAFAVVRDVGNQFVFRYHLEELRCEQSKEIASLAVIILENQLLDHQSSMRRNERRANGSGVEIPDQTAEEIRDRLEDEHVEDTLKSRLAEQHRRRLERCND